jgi:hypothetical protein
VIPPRKTWRACGVRPRRPVPEASAPQ